MEQLFKVMNGLVTTYPKINIFLNLATDRSVAIAITHEGKTFRYDAANAETVAQMVEAAFNFDVNEYKKSGKVKELFTPSWDANTPVTAPSAAPMSIPLPPPLPLPPRT